ncbi:MAG: tyrosine-type recombinase/integrase [Oscillospiraceae bacterium]
MARKGENIYKRKDGRWEGRLPNGSKPDGKTRYRSVYGFSYLDVKKKLKTAVPSPVPLHKKSDEITIGEIAEKWLGVQKIKCKPSSLNKYFNICKNHIIPNLGSVKMQLLKAEHVEQMLNQNAKLSPKTLQDILCVTKMLVSFAKSIGTECRADLSMISVKAEKKQIRVFSIAEQQRLLDYLQDNDSKIAFGVYLTLCTGLRIGELCALKKKDFSFENGSLFVDKTLQRIQTPNSETKTKIIIASPKSSSSIREIPLTDELLSRAFEVTENTPDESFLLTGKTDKFIEPTVMRYHFGKILSACGLKDAHFHTLRHTFATRCVEAGVDIKSLSEILGHESVNITLNRYVHSSRDFKRENMKKLLSSAAYSPSKLSSKS